MNIATVRTKLRKGKHGTFRPLKVGELIEERDVVVTETSYDWIAEQEVGEPCEKQDTIMRLEFEK